jgi:hypothetical protein
LAEKFGVDTKNARRCPGEPDCERYSSAAGATAEEKARACISCSVCQGLAPLPELVTDDEEIEELVDTIERAVWEQHAGRRFGLDEFSPEEWQLIVLWRGLEREFALVNELKMTAILEAAFLKKS